MKASVLETSSENKSINTTIYCQPTKLIKIKYYFN